MDRVVLGSTIVFAPYTIDQALEGLAEAGYHACEIGAVKGWFEHIDPDSVSDAEIDRIGRKLADLGITPVSLSGHAQLQTAEGAARFGRAINIAAALGMEVVNTYTGDATTAEERDAYFVNVAELCDRAARHGLKIGMETDSNMLPTAEAGREILDRIDRPDVLGFNYDPGNVVYYTGADPRRMSISRCHALSTFISKTRSAARASSTSRRRATANSTWGVCWRSWQKLAMPGPSAPRSSLTSAAGPTTTPALPPPSARSRTCTVWA